ncbi:MAG: M48 family metalloprotease, partial [Phycisphaerales bacterium]
MNAIIERINEVGYAFVKSALPMLIQSGVLVIILLLVDLLLRRRVRAVFRYWIWMLVLVKLLLPTSLSSPISIGRWFGDKLTYVDVNRAPAPEPEVNVAPAPVVEAPLIVDTPRVETVTHAPAVVPVAPTIQHAEPTVAESIGPPPEPTTPLSWQAVAFLTWLAVFIVMMLLLLQRAVFVRRLVAHAAAGGGKMADLLKDCCERMAVRRSVGLKVSAGATSPAVCGLLRPVILVPKKLTPGLTSGELRVVLLHELAHIKRRDLWVNFAQTLLQMFYFYNPLLWLANTMIRRAREQAVDEMVLVAMGEKARQYPETLVNVAKLAFKRPALSLRLIGVVESKSALTGRIKHILGRPMPKTAKLGILGLVVVLVAAAILLPMAAFMPGSPELVVKGVVKDAQTGKPIAGARVFDDGYGPTPSWDQIRANERSEWGAITNAAGEYSFLTWSEHHCISAEAPGYKPERKTLYDSHFTINTNDEETMNFVLEPVEGPEGMGSDSTGAESVSPAVPILGYDVKLNFADPTVRDGSFHSYQSVSFSMSFHSFDSLQTDTLFGQLLIGQATLPILLKGDLITVQDGSVGRTIRSEMWPADEPQFEKVVELPLKYGQREYSCPVRVELMRQQGGNPIGSYWFCAYLSGRLPWGAGGRIFEIVNLDQQMEFRPIGDGTDKRDAVLGIDINGDGKIDHSETGGEQSDLYEPFKIGSKTYRVAEVDPYLPRVVFHEVHLDQSPSSDAKLDVQLEGSDNLFTVYGTVTDESGRPVEGVQLTADCGHGKLERTGRAVTDRSGRYTLGLTSSIKNLGADPYDVGIQTARIEARARGFCEANICRDGNLAMAGKTPGPDGQRFVADYAGVVLPHKPYELNFVMRPAARIEGELVDGQGSPMPRLMLWLQGDGLYLSKRVDIYGRSDRNGKFVIEDIPCKSIWFNCPQPKLARSGTVELAMPGTYRVKLQYVESASGEPSLKIAELRGPASVSSETSQSGLNGRIVDAAGSPIAGAQVAFSTDKIGVQISDGKLKPIRSGVESRIVQTDLRGAFA